MKIFSTALDDLNSFKNFFQGHSVELLPENFEGIEIDLLLFPGGADIHPNRYSGKIPKDSQYKHWIDEERDEWEFKVIKNVFMGKLTPKKTLGVCRGMQFLNVAMGGVLLYDIYSRYGRSHANVHPIVWQIENVFSSIQKVNSLHHQGIYGLGNNLRPVILGVEPNTGVIEAVMWGNSYLGLQFHPEYWGNEDEKNLLSSRILDWVIGGNIVTGGRIEGRENKYNAFSAGFAFISDDESEESMSDFDYDDESDDMEEDE